ncbi:MAG: histidine phosphatase family protein [Acidimicrobiia bacterium]|nr:histidine phosphatase family protein [Acidimicrobiia bacterium]
MTDKPKRVAYLLVRHGEAEGNREYRFIGQMDVPLSELGRCQADLVSQRLGSTGVTRILSSDLQRASATMEPLAATGIPMLTDVRLREIDNGQWAGLLPEEIEHRWPDMWERYRTGEDVARPDGERWADVQARAIAAIESDLERADDGDIVAVASHGGPTVALIMWALGLPLGGSIFRGPIAPIHNASISTVLMPSRRIGGLNDVGHLGALVSEAKVRFLER